MRGILRSLRQRDTVSRRTPHQCATAVTDSLFVALSKSPQKMNPPSSQPTAKESDLGTKHPLSLCHARRIPSSRPVSVWEDGTGQRAGVFFGPVSQVAELPAEAPGNRFVVLAQIGFGVPRSGRMSVVFNHDRPRILTQLQLLL
jgi:hypothetical protein